MARTVQLAHTVNSVLRFGLELTALYGLARLGHTLAGSDWTQLLTALALPALMVLLWGSFVAPKARVKLPVLARLALELVLFGAAAWGVARAHGSAAGGSFFVVSTLSSWLNAATAPTREVAARR